jgi:hypothetical protein
VLERLGRDVDEPRRELYRGPVREAAEHDMGHRVELRAKGVVQNGMVVSVNGGPPRRHAVYQLAAVGESQANAARGFHELHRQRLGDRAVGMPNVPAVLFEQNISGVML